MTNVFRFPLDAPALTGSLLKQGDFGLHQSKKFVVLYPGFLVFYDNAERWKLDVKGGTLSGRSGAVYLKSSKVEEAAPGVTKYRFAFSVTAPGPGVCNKKKNLLLIASNEKEKEEWMNSITKAIPVGKETKTITVPPRSPERPIKETKTVTKSPLALDNGILLEDACAIAADKLQNPQPTSIIMLQKEKTPVMETLPNATEDQSPVIDVIRTHLPFPTAISAQLDGNSTGDEKIATCMSPALPNVACGTNPTGNMGITPPVVIVRAALREESRVYKADRENDSVSSASNSLYTSSERNSGLLGTALQRLSIESLLDSDSRSDCSRSDSGDDYLDDDEVARAEVDDSLGESQNWLCKIGDRTCQCPPDNTSYGCPFNSTSYEQDETALPIDNLCGTGHTSCPPGGISCHQISCGPTKCLGDASLCGLDGDNMSKVKDTLRMQDGHPSSVFCALNDSRGLGSSNYFSSVSSGLSDSASSALSDSAVFDEDSTADTFTHGNIVETKAGSDTSMMIVITSHKEASSAAAEPLFASSTIDTTTASRTDAEVFRGKSGFIFKLNENGRGWNPRYLVIYPGYFCYYKHSSSLKPRGVVKLRKSSVACTATEKRPYQFSVHTESTQNRRSDWVFAAHGKKAMQEWIVAFQLAGQKPQ